MDRRLSERESEITGLLARALVLSPHTVQDHLKSVFAKTGVNSRSELGGQIFLEHYATRWEDVTSVPAGWTAKASPVPAGAPWTSVADPPDARRVRRPEAHEDRLAAGMSGPCRYGAQDLSAFAGTRSRFHPGHRRSDCIIQPVAQTLTKATGRRSQCTCRRRPHSDG